jgi:23S rRNA pseudouridine2605 synthase
LKKLPLDRALSKLGLATRAEARALVREGRVGVDGVTVTDPAFPVIPERIRLTIDGRSPGAKRWTLIALHKPRGVVTTRRDPQGRPTVYDFLEGLDTHVIPVGRLDATSSGLLLLTNDTRLADGITDPANGIVRRYVVTVRGELSNEDARRLEVGTESPVGHLRARRVAIRKRSRRETHLLVELTEGRNREIRRMLAAVDHEVKRLKRIGIGGLELGTLPPGRWRRVSAEEARASFPLLLRPRSRGRTRRGGGIRRRSARRAGALADGRIPR